METENKEQSTRTSDSRKSHKAFWFENPEERNQREDPEMDINKAKRIHFHYKECYKGQLGNQLGEYYIRMLFSHAAQKPFRMSCGETTNNAEIRGDESEERIRSST